MKYFPHFLKKLSKKMHTSFRCDVPSDSSRGPGFLYVSQFVGKFIVFIINFQNCFEQDLQISNILSARVVMTNTGFGNKIKRKYSKRPFFDRFIVTK